MEPDETEVSEVKGMVLFRDSRTAVSYGRQPE